MLIIIDLLVASCTAWPRSSANNVCLPACLMTLLLLPSFLLALLSTLLPSILLLGVGQTKTQQSVPVPIPYLLLSFEQSTVCSIHAEHLASMAIAYASISADDVNGLSIMIIVLIVPGGCGDGCGDVLISLSIAVGLSLLSSSNMK